MHSHCGSILIVDDDQPFRELVSLSLARAGYSSVEAATGEEALAAARRERPDAVLLDIQLEGMSGYAICRELRDQFGEQLPIIFLSGARTEPSDLVAGLLIGADDYMTKPLDPDELLARLKRAVTRSAAGERSSNDPMTETVSRLTPRERDVLGLLAEGLGTGAIAEKLYISPKTVGTHVQRILAKLDMHSRAEAVAFAYREGLVEDVSAHTLVDSGSPIATLAASGARSQGAGRTQGTPRL
jgi:DNA-binding NarL/FixJ family response regulator